MIAATLAGFLTGFSLILAIGAQNAFVLRQGLIRAHVFWICLTCAASDALLISFGVAGMGALVQELPWLERGMRFGGAAFLIFYGALHMRSALQPRGLAAAANSAPSLGAALGTTLALTWLNPHVYLDTLALIGALSTAYDGADRWAFGVGAIVASFVFFFSLGYGARLLAPIFARPSAWAVLDAVIALVMWSIGLGLLLI